MVRVSKIGAGAEPVGVGEGRGAGLLRGRRGRHLPPHGRDPATLHRAHRGYSVHGHSSTGSYSTVFVNQHQSTFVHCPISILDILNHGPNIYKDTKP